MDCENEGDLLCDTNADMNVDDNVINVNCEYTGTLKDECDVSYLMEENNIMTYGQRSCRDRFTNGQGARARTYLLRDHENRIAEDILTILEDPNLTGGLHIYAFRNLISISAPGFTISQTANVNLSSRGVVLVPGVDLKPSEGGYISVRAGTYCQ